MEYFMMSMLVIFGIAVVYSSFIYWKYSTKSKIYNKQEAIEKALEEQSKKTKCKIVFSVGEAELTTKYIEPFNLGDYVMTPDASAMATLAEFYKRGYFSAEDGRTFPASRVNYAYIVKDVKGYQ
jgi:hypothetical protein